MKTQFEKWYFDTFGSMSAETDESNKAFYAWNACKKEVLKILNKNKRNYLSYPSEGDGYDFDAIDKSVIEEIEKL